MDMAGKIFNIQDNGDLVEMNERGFVTEDAFQLLLERHPDLLAGDQIQSDSPRRWLLIKREMGVADQPSGSDRWSLDHLFIDQDGIPTLVEVKRSTDTRLRREVVGQVLDYAANAVAHWSLDQIQAEYRQQCDRDDIDPDERLDSFVDSDDDKDLESKASAFWQSVKTNLMAGKVRLLFVADVIPHELRRIIEFLNSQMDPAEVLGVEIRQYVGQGIRTLVPRVIGQTAEAEQRKKIGDGSSNPTRINLNIDGKPYLNQFKRRAILRYVQALVDNGRSPNEIDEVIHWRQVFYEVPPDTGAETVGERLSQLYGANPETTWFLKDEEMVKHEGNTYAMVKQWGPRTEEALRLLTEKFKPKNISYEVVS